MMESDVVVERYPTSLNPPVPTASSKCRGCHDYTHQLL
jgi:hypothetical protein